MKRSKEEDEEVKEKRNKNGLNGSKDLIFFFMQENVYSWIKCNKYLLY